MKKIILMGMMLLLTFNLFVSADSDHGSFDEAKKIVDSQVSCSDLTDKQLELLGDYYMEQMHPGEAHVSMDKMMGGEGSEQLKLMHIQMAKKFYCKESVDMMGSGMMSMMMGNSGMMQGGNKMMGTGYGMMGYGTGFWGINSILYTILLLGLVVLVWLWAWKLWKSSNKKK